MPGRRLLLAGMLVVPLLLATASSARACSCLPLAPKEAVAGADAAIVGRLLGVLRRDSTQADYRYSVRRIFKGPRRLEPGGVVSVRGQIGGAACGLPSAVGRRYGLLLTWRAGRWRGGLCGVLAPRELAATSGGSRRLEAHCAS